MRWIKALFIALITAILLSACGADYELEGKWESYEAYDDSSGKYDYDGLYIVFEKEDGADGYVKDGDEYYFTIT